MIHSFQRRARHAVGVAAAALLAVPLAAQAADYRAQFSESFNSGLAGARPAITFRTVIDNGSGGAPIPTGILRYTVDSRHLTSSAWASLLAATPGTQLGTFTSELTGTSALRVLSHGKDAGGAYVLAGIDVPGRTAALIGDDNLTIVIRRTPSASHLTFVLDIRTAVGRLIARGAPATLQTVTLALRSSIVYGGKSHGDHAQPGRTDRADQLRRRPRMRRCHVRERGDRRRLECHGTPAEDRDARRSCERRRTAIATRSGARAAPETTSASMRSTRSA